MAGSKSKVLIEKHKISVVRSSKMVSINTSSKKQTNVASHAIKNKYLAVKRGKQSQLINVVFYLRQYIGSKLPKHSLNNKFLQCARLLHQCTPPLLCCIMHSVHTGRCPAYLKNTVQLAAARQSRCDLRSSSTSAYLLSRLKTKFGERAFSRWSGPSAWNALLYPRRRRS